MARTEFHVKAENDRGRGMADVIASLVLCCILPVFPPTALLAHGIYPVDFLLVWQSPQDYAWGDLNGFAVIRPSDDPIENAFEYRSLDSVGRR